MNMVFEFSSMSRLYRICSYLPNSYFKITLTFASFLIDISKFLHLLLQISFSNYLFKVISLCFPALRVVSYTYCNTPSYPILFYESRYEYICLLFDISLFNLIKIQNITEIFNIYQIPIIEEDNSHTISPCFNLNM